MRIQQYIRYDIRCKTRMKRKGIALNLDTIGHKNEKIRAKRKMQN